MLFEPERSKLLAELEKLGPEIVRERLTDGRWSHRKNSTIRAWLLEKDRESDGRRFKSSESRADESLSLSRESNGIAREALGESKKGNALARCALIVAILAALATAVDLAWRLFQ